MAAKVPEKRSAVDAGFQAVEAVDRNGTGNLEVAVKLADCAVPLVLVTVAVTNTVLPGPVQTSGSVIFAVIGGAAALMVNV